MSDYSKTPLYILLDDMAKLEQEILLKSMIYEKMRQEVCTRFPILEENEDDEVFKPKVYTLKKNVRR